MGAPIDHVVVDLSSEWDEYELASKIQSVTEKQEKRRYGNQFLRQSYIIGELGHFKPLRYLDPFGRTLARQAEGIYIRKANVLYVRTSRSETGGTVLWAGSMTDDTTVTLPDTLVMFVAGQAGKPIAEQAPRAFEALEIKLASLRGRKFYGAVLGDEYRACVTIDRSDDPGSLPHPTWTLPGGKYARRRILDWEQHLHLIGPTIQALLSRTDVDTSRPCLEFYRSQKELLVMVPVLEPAPR